MHARLHCRPECILHHQGFRSQPAKSKYTSYQQMHDSGPSEQLSPFNVHNVADRNHVKVSTRESEVAKGAPEGKTARETIQAS